MSPEIYKRRWFWPVAVISVGIAVWVLIWKWPEPTIPPAVEPTPDSSTVPHYIIHLNDHLGSMTLVTDQNANVVEQISYSPFGEITYHNPPSPPFNKGGNGGIYLYTGQELDESQLYYYGARYYDPVSSRFVSVDPVDQYPKDPYAYVKDNPILYIDPKGLFLERITTYTEPIFQMILGYPRDSHVDEAITAEKFVEWARGKSLAMLQHESDYEGPTSSSHAGGPDREYRYVIDPGNPSVIIDMRHFLVIGENSKLFGEPYGLSVELAQLLGLTLLEIYPLAKDKDLQDLERDLQDSAFDSQDFYSNALGVEFFGNFYDPEGKPFWEQLQDYLDYRQAQYEQYLAQFWENSKIVPEEVSVHRK